MGWDGDPRYPFPEDAIKDVVGMGQRYLPVTYNQSVSDRYLFHALLSYRAGPQLQVLLVVLRTV